MIRWKWKSWDDWYILLFRGVAPTTRKQLDNVG